MISTAQLAVTLRRPVVCIVPMLQRVLAHHSPVILQPLGVNVGVLTGTVVLPGVIEKVKSAVGDVWQ